MDFREKIIQIQQDVDDDRLQALRIHQARADSYVDEDSKAGLLVTLHPPGDPTVYRARDLPERGDVDDIPLLAIEGNPSITHFEHGVQVTTQSAYNGAARTNIFATGILEFYTEQTVVRDQELSGPHVEAAILIAAAHGLRLFEELLNGTAVPKIVISIINGEGWSFTPLTGVETFDKPVETTFPVSAIANEVDQAMSTLSPAIDDLWRRLGSSGSEVVTDGEWTGDKALNGFLTE